VPPRRFDQERTAWYFRVNQIIGKQTCRAPDGLSPRNGVIRNGLNAALV